MICKSLLHNYGDIIERYRNTELDTDIIAIVEKNYNQPYNITYNPYSSPCSCGPFETLEEVHKTIKKHRPTAELIQQKSAIFSIIRLSQDSCRIVPVNRIDKELTAIAGGGGVISNLETMLDIIEQIENECEAHGYEYKIK